MSIIDVGNILGAVLTTYRVIVALISMALLAVVALAMGQHPQSRQPHFVIAVPDDIKIEILLEEQATADDCAQTVRSISRLIDAICLGCAVERNECLSALDSQQRRMLSGAQLSTPSARLSNGVIVYSSRDPLAALAACRETARRAEGKSQPIFCDMGGAPGQVEQGVSSSRDLIMPWLMALLAAGASWFVCYLILRYEHLHAHFSHDMLGGGPQKFHAVPTPRIGGVGLMAALLVAGGGFLAIPAGSQSMYFGYLLLAGAPAFLGGLVEDITKRVGVLERLLLTMLSAACGAWLLGAVLPRIGVPGLDVAFSWLPFAVVFTVFAIGGVANAVNIIDGYNGLASGYAVIALLGFAWVSVQVSDMFLLNAALMMLGALVGFMVWNWPKGRIFLGDGGAYLVGFWLGELAVLLVSRHPEISPWFPMLVLVYPVFETLFSIYRRKVLRRGISGSPDALHLHQLVYSRFVRIYVGSRLVMHKGRRNALVAPHIWVFVMLLTVLPALFFWERPGFLVAFVVTFCVAYVWVYRRLVRWRTPSWAFLWDRFFRE